MQKGGPLFVGVSRGWDDLKFWISFEESAQTTYQITKSTKKLEIYDIDWLQSLYVINSPNQRDNGNQVGINFQSLCYSFRIMWANHNNNVSESKKQYRQIFISLWIKIHNNFFEIHKEHCNHSVSRGWFPLVEGENLDFHPPFNPSRSSETEFPHQEVFVI